MSDERGSDGTHARTLRQRRRCVPWASCVPGLTTRSGNSCATAVRERRGDRRLHSSPRADLGTQFASARRQEVFFMARNARPVGPTNAASSPEQGSERSRHADATRQQQADPGRSRSGTGEGTDYGRSPWWAGHERRPLRRRPLDRHREHEVETESHDALEAISEPNEELASARWEREPFTANRADYGQALQGPLERSAAPRSFWARLWR